MVENYVQLMWLVHFLQWLIDREGNKFKLNWSKINHVEQNYFRKIVLCVIGIDKAGKSTAIKAISSGIFINFKWFSQTPCLVSIKINIVYHSNSNAKEPVTTSYSPRIKYILPGVLYSFDGGQTLISSLKSVKP